MVAQIIILCIYVAILLVIGFVSRRKAKTVNDFFLGGRKMGAWMTAFAYGTTYFSAVIFMGYAGKFGLEHGHLRRMDRHRQRAHRLVRGMEADGAAHARNHGSGSTPPRCPISSRNVTSRRT